MHVCSICYLYILCLIYITRLYVLHGFYIFYVYVFSVNGCLFCLDMLKIYSTFLLSVIKIHTTLEKRQ